MRPYHFEGTVHGERARTIVLSRLWALIGFASCPTCITLVRMRRPPQQRWPFALLIQRVLARIFHTFACPRRTKGNHQTHIRGLFQPYAG